MLRFNRTMMAMTYGRYKQDYLQARLQNKLSDFEVGETAVVSANQSNKDLPRTNLPFVIEPESLNNTTDKTIVLYDANGVRGVEADLRFTNAILMAAYEDVANAERFHVIRKLATKAYINWVARNVAKRFQFDFEDKMKLDILFGVFYYASHSTPKEVFDERNYKSLSDMASITGYGAIRVQEVLKEFKIADIDETLTFRHIVDICGLISDKAAKVLTVNNIMATTAHSWYGEGGVFYCNLAIEYPPMFITLMYFALVDRSYKRTALGVAVKEFVIGRNVQDGELFTKQLGAIIKGLGVKEI